MRHLAFSFIVCSVALPSFLHGTLYGGEIPVIGIEGGEQRIKEAQQSVVTSIQRLCPPVAELGDGWRQRGSVRGYVPGDSLGGQSLRDLLRQLR